MKNESIDKILEEIEVQRITKLIEDPNLLAKDLWGLSKNDFKKWRIKHDYPKLLKSFNDTVPSFVEWKKEFNIEDDMLMECSIFDFTFSNKMSKDKTKYLLEQTFNGVKRRLVSYEDLTGTSSGLDEDEAYSLIKKFTPYEDWCNDRKIEPSLFSIHHRSNNGTEERVFLNSGYELLKMGGLTIGTGSDVSFIPKDLEFVNLCSLKFEGKLYSTTTYGKLELSYSAIDHLYFANFEMPLVDFFNCTIEDLSIINSTVQNWQFWECKVSGSISYSKLRNIRIEGGEFTPYINETFIFNVQANHIGNKKVNFDYIYKTLKTIYQNQGDDSNAIINFVKEKELVRESSRRWSKIEKTFSHYYWEYGTQPKRIVYYSILIIFICAFVYWLNPNSIHKSDGTLSFFKGFYISVATFTTLGFADIYPIGSLRILVMIEAFLGAFNIGFLIAGLANTKL